MNDNKGEKGSSNLKQRYLNVFYQQQRLKIKEDRSPIQSETRIKTYY